MLHKIVELEKPEISDEVLKAEIEKIIAKFQNEEVVKKLRDLYVAGESHYEELKQRMKYRKLIDGFFKE
ncbi:MAG: hypothetical protein LBF15_04315 [Candidatus Peribacteria bacterium]|nr:hypothetical protein [Candidatus Peribacteria bacterium]